MKKERDKQIRDIKKLSEHLHGEISQNPDDIDLIGQLKAEKQKLNNENEQEINGFLLKSMPYWVERAKKKKCYPRNKKI